jgi:deoxyribodipyrimidine photo-lyase
MGPVLRSDVPATRVRAGADRPPRSDVDHVLYWMTMARRTGWNFGLQRAVEWARHLGKPLIVLEALRCDYPWASDRLHRFVLDGMADHAARLARHRVLYYPYVEPAPGAGKGLLAALAARAAVVVTDDFPAFFLPRMLEAAARQVTTRFELVDSNGLLPLRAAERAFPTAYTFRRFLQRALPAHLDAAPAADPLARARLPVLRALPAAIVRRWPPASPALLAGAPAALAALPIDHGVGAVALRGGTAAGAQALAAFVADRLARYPERRSQPEVAGTSGLSPYLHFGHVSTHQVLAAVAAREGWTPARAARTAPGRRTGWWRMSAAAEAFLEQLVTWRELGFNTCAHRPDHARYESLPAWARATLAKHAGDRRPHVYPRDVLEAGGTHDPLWNAAQMQLVRDGWFHNSLRMLWGKKILEWSARPEDAIPTMAELMNRHALDGRGPNAWSGYFWTLGRYDRPWGPERPIFGTVRYMSSASAARKLRVREYVRRYAP